MCKNSVFGRGRRPSRKEIASFVSSEGCKLVSKEYTNQDTKMDFVCSCGEAFTTTLRTFRKGARCASCTSVKLSNRFLTPFEEVRKMVEDAGCTMLSKRYDAKTPIEYMCSCGNPKPHRASLDSFKKGARCKECWRRNIIANKPHRFSYEYVRKYFEDHGCQLVSTHYQNGKHQKLDYICKCGRPAKIKFSAFKRGQRCFQCMVDGLSGENSRWYNPNITDEERALRDKRKRKTAGYRQWRREVFERDGHKCLKCGASEELEAHHLYSFAEHIALRFEVDNGATLCDPCHTLFHTCFGTKNNTKEQFEEFMTF